MSGDTRVACLVGGAKCDKNAWAIALDHEEGAMARPDSLAVVERVVIVGAGLAGGRCAVELRKQGYTGRITLVGAEPHLPYDRPPLSKAVLSGRIDDTTLPLGLDGVELLAGRCATGLEPGRLDTDGGPLDYDGLVVATGATPVTLPGDGLQRVLRTIDDARALRDALKPGCRLAVVGAGWIGAEVATAAAKRGAEVTVVEAGPAPLAQALGEQVGACTASWYEQAGVTLRPGVGVEAVRAGGLDLRGGEHLVADEVVVGVGVRPDLAWAGGALATDRGIAVDERLSAAWAPPGTDGPPVVAVGDCAAWWSRRYGTRLRVEHWDNAQHAPAVAAATLLAGSKQGDPGSSAPGGADGSRGGTHRITERADGSNDVAGVGVGEPLLSEPWSGGEVYDPVPYFWSEQFGHMVQFAGHRGGGEAAVWRGSPGAGGERGPGGRPVGWSAGWFAADGRLVALVTVDRPLDMVQGRRLILAGAAPDPGAFANISVPLKQLG